MIGTATKNSAPFFVSSSIEVIIEMEDQVFCTRKFKLAAIINHSGNLNSDCYTCLVMDGGMWWHCNDKAVVPVNMNDISKSLPYVLISGCIFFFLCVCDFCIYLYVVLTDNSLIFGNQSSHILYNLSSVGGSSLVTWILRF